MPDDEPPAGSEPAPTVGEAVVCALCGRVAAGGAPLDWTTQLSERGRGVEHVCDRCSREHLRSIEARLSAEWW